MSPSSSYQQASESSRQGFQIRLREYILRKHGSMNAFCRAVGIKYPAQMTPYLKGRCMPGKKMLTRLENDGADIEWMLNGYSGSASETHLGGALMLSRYRMDIERLLREVSLHMVRHDGMYSRGIEAYAVLDSECRIVELTGSLEKFLLYEKNALVEARLQTLIHPEDFPDVESVMRAERIEEDILSFSSKFRTGAGGYMQVDWSLFIRNRPMSDMNEYTMILRKACC